MQQLAISAKVLTVDEAAQQLHISRSGLYRLILSNQLRSIKIGNRRFVRPMYIDEYLNRVEQEQQEGWDA